MTSEPVQKSSTHALSSSQIEIQETLSNYHAASLIRAFETEHIIYKDLINSIVFHVKSKGYSQLDEDFWNINMLRPSLELELGSTKAANLLSRLDEFETVRWGIRCCIKGKERLGDTSMEELFIRIVEREDLRGWRQNCFIRFSDFLRSKAINSREKVIVVGLQSPEMGFLRCKIEEIKSCNINTLRLLDSTPRLPIAPSSLITNIQSQIYQKPTRRSVIIIASLPSSSKPLRRGLHRNPQKIHPAPRSVSQEIILPSAVPTQSLPALFSQFIRSQTRAFYVQVLLFIAAMGMTLVWALCKNDLGTATGLGGLILGVGSMINMVEKSCREKLAKDIDDEMKVART